MQMLQVALVSRVSFSGENAIGYGVVLSCCGCSCIGTIVMNDREDGWLAFVMITFVHDDGKGQAVIHCLNSDIWNGEIIAQAQAIILGSSSSSSSSRLSIASLIF